MLWHGVTDEVTPFAFIVEDFLMRKELAKLGFRFDPSNLTDFQVEAYSAISLKLSKLKMEKLNKK